MSVSKAGLYSKAGRTSPFVIIPQDFIGRAKNKNSNSELLAKSCGVWYNNINKARKGNAYGNKERNI